MSIYKPPDFAITTAEPSSFEVLNQRSTFEKIVPKPESIPKGRPLFTRELSKKNPPPTTYEAESTFGSRDKHLKTKACTFKNTYDSYRRTCDIQNNIKVFHNDPDTA